MADVRVHILQLEGGLTFVKRFRSSTAQSTARNFPRCPVGLIRMFMRIARLGIYSKSRCYVFCKCFTLFALGIHDLTHKQA